MRVVRDLPDISVTTTQRVAFGILCNLEDWRDAEFIEWAYDWLSGKDRSALAAEAAAEAALAAEAEAEAAEAAEAARAAWAAARAAEAAARAAWAAAAEAARAVWAASRAADCADLNGLAREALKY